MRRKVNAKGYVNLNIDEIYSLIISGGTLYD